MPDAKPYESYFLSLSARNKYLTDEEKVVYGLGRSEMFHQQIVSSKEKILRAVRRCETTPEAFTTKTGLSVPIKAMVCYINLFCSDSFKAIEEFQTIMVRNMAQTALQSSEGKSTTDSIKAINKAPKTLLDCYQRARGSSNFIDIDFDIPKEEVSLVKKFMVSLLEKNATSTCIDTRSGYHVLIDRATLKFNYNDVIQVLNTKARMRFGASGENFKWEIVKNDNMMIPLPGTYQAGHPVRILDW